MAGVGSRATKLAFSVMLLFQGGPAIADPADEAALADLRACFEAELDNTGRACIGQVAEACRAEGGTGETTLGATQCAQREARAWDRILNEEYAKTRSWAEEADLYTGDSAPELATYADSLLAAQRAWILFRDAECRLAYAQWGDGSLRHVAAATCMLDMTAERAIALFEMREGEGI